MSRLKASSMYAAMRIDFDAKGRPIATEGRPLMLGLKAAGAIIDDNERAEAAAAFAQATIEVGVARAQAIDTASRVHGVSAKTVRAALRAMTSGHMVQVEYVKGMVHYAMANVAADGTWVTRFPWEAKVFVSPKNAQKWLDERPGLAGKVVLR